MTERDDAYLLPMPPARPVLPERMRMMLRVYGTHDGGGQCGDCILLLERPYHGRVYFKCGLNRVTRGPGSDWRKWWPACGMFERRGEIKIEDEDG